MSSDFAAARLNMVESQIRTADVTDLPLQDALRVVPRETLVPAGKGYLAYADADVEYAPGRWLLRPRDVGKLLQHLRPREGDKALAIAAPYAASGPRRDLCPGRGRRGPPRGLRRHPADAGRLRRRTGLCVLTTSVQKLKRNACVKKA
jgi:hypothetical protein